MKKTLSLLSLATLITTFSGMAHAENLFVTNQYRGMNGIQVTVTENNVVKDSICIQSSSMAYLSDYEPKHSYLIKAEIKEGYGCDGRSINSFENKFDIGSSDLQVEVNDYRIVIREQY